MVKRQKMQTIAIKHRKKSGQVFLGEMFCIKSNQSSATVALFVQYQIIRSISKIGDKFPKIAKIAKIQCFVILNFMLQNEIDVERWGNNRKISTAI